MRIAVKIPIAIKGAALLTPLDEPGGRDTWQAMLAGERVGERTAVAEGLLPEIEGLDRSIRLALAAVRRMGLPPGTGRDLGLFCGTSKGPVGTVLAGLDRLRAGGSLSALAAEQIALGPAAMGVLLPRYLEIRGVGSGHTSVAACSSGLHAVHRAVTALQRGECQRALVVAADASLHELFEGSFARLGVMAPRNADGCRRCEPFGDKGEGFFLVEAAAAMLLERTSSNAADGPPPPGTIEETCIAADSTGLIAVDDQTRTLRDALRRMSADRSLAFVHAHATGTAHDRYELSAIRSICGESVPVFSHKAWLGHSLGAAGLVSLVLSLMAHRAGRTPAGTRVCEGASITLAQGFGGHIAAVRIR